MFSGLTAGFFWVNFRQNRGYQTGPIWQAGLYITILARESKSLVSKNELSNLPFEVVAHLEYLEREDDVPISPHYY